MFDLGLEKWRDVKLFYLVEKKNKRIENIVMPLLNTHTHITRKKNWSLCIKKNACQVLKVGKKRKKNICGKQWGKECRAEWYLVFTICPLFSLLFFGGWNLVGPKRKSLGLTIFSPLFPSHLNTHLSHFFPSLSFRLNQMDCKQFFFSFCFSQCTTNLHSCIRLSNGFEAKWLRVESPLSMNFILSNLTFFFI